MSMFSLFFLGGADGQDQGSQNFTGFIGFIGLEKATSLPLYSLLGALRRLCVLYKEPQSLIFFEISIFSNE